MVGFCDLFGTPYAPVSKIPSVKAAFEMAGVPYCLIDTPYQTYMGAVGRCEWRIVAREEHSGVNLFTTLMYVLSNPSLCF